MGSNNKEMHLWYLDASCTYFPQREREMSMGSARPSAPSCHHTEHLALRWWPLLSALCLPLPTCTSEVSGHLWATLAMCIASHWTFTCFFCVSLQNIDFLEHLGATRMLGLSLALSYEEHLSLYWCGFIFPVLLLGLFLWVCLWQRKNSAFPFWLRCHT